MPQATVQGDRAAEEPLWRNPGAYPLATWEPQTCDAYGLEHALREPSRCGAVRARGLAPGNGTTDAQDGGGVVVGDP